MIWLEAAMDKISLKVALDSSSQYLWQITIA